MRHNSKYVRVLHEKSLQNIRRHIPLVTTRFTPNESTYIRDARLTGGMLRLDVLV